MSWTFDSQIANGGNATGNTTSLTLTTTANAEVGRFLVLRVGKDNVFTTGSQQVAEVTSVTDSAGNRWYQAYTWANPGTAQSTTACSLWWCYVGTQINSGGTVVMTWGSAAANNDAQCGTIDKYTLSSGFPAFVAATGSDTDAADPAAITLSGLTSGEYLWIHVLSGEGQSTDAYTWDANYTQSTVAGGNSGTAATSQHVTGGHRIFTGTSDTVDVTSTTADRDYAQILAVFKEVTTSGGSGGPVQLVNSGGLVG